MKLIVEADKENDVYTLIASVIISSLSRRQLAEDDTN